MVREEEVRERKEEAENEELMGDGEEEKERVGGW